MRKISIAAGVLAMVMGMGAVSTASSAFAAGCTANDLPPISLSHDSMIPNAGFGYNKDAYDAALAKGNACPTVRQGLRTSRNSLESHPNEATGSDANVSVN